MMIHALLAANCCLIAVHVFLRFIVYFDFNRDTFFHPDLLLTTDGGYPEIFNYLQLAALGLLMLCIFFRTRQVIYIVSAMIFLLALGDDALNLHERFGDYAASTGLPGTSDLRADHVGELLYWLGAGALAFAALVYGFSTSSSEDRRIGGIFVLLIFMLGFFAAVIDAAHSVLRGKFFGSALILDVVEDGGEMLTAALALSTALLLFRHLDDLRRPSRQGIRSEDLSSSRAQL